MKRDFLSDFQYSYVLVTFTIPFQQVFAVEPVYSLLTFCTTTVKPGAEPFLALTWSINGTTIALTSTSVDVVETGNRITLDKTTGSLVFRNLIEKDSGEYELIIIPRGAQQVQEAVLSDFIDNKLLLQLSIRLYSPYFTFLFSTRVCSCSHKALAAETFI